MKYHKLINKNVINDAFSVEILDFNLCKFIEESTEPVTFQSVQKHFGQIKNRDFSQKFLDLLIQRKFNLDGIIIKTKSDYHQFYKAAIKIVHESRHTNFSSRLIKELSSEVDQNYINIEVLIQKVVSIKIELAKKTLNLNGYEARIFNLFKFYDDYYNKVDRLINTIDEKFQTESINNILYFEENSTLLNQLGIKTLGDLKKINIEFILCLLFDEIEILITNLYVYSDSLNEEIKIALDRFKEKLEPRQWEVLLLRYGKGDKTFTLDEIGKSMHLTRERIRQIERKAIDSLRILYSQNEYIFNSLLYSLTKEHDLIYDTNQELIQILGSNERLFMFRILLSSFSNIFQYSKTFSCYYSLKNGSENSLKDHFVNKLGVFIRQEDYLTKNEVLKKIINNIYKPKQSGWLKKGVSIKELIINLISREFKDGYHISSNLHYEKIKKIFGEEFGSDLLTGFPSKRSLFGFIDRSNYIQINRGTYIDATYSPKIEETLKIKILSYLKNSNKVVYYLTLYLEFKNELIQNGISNHYHLKGLLDPLLLGKYDYYRDYIKTRNLQSSPLETIRSLIQSEKMSFSMSHIKNRFPGVKSYVFWNILYEEENTKGLIRINRDEFIYANKLHVEQSTINKLKDFIDKHLTEDNLIVSSKKLYGKLYYEEPDLLKNLNFIKNHFGLFSLIKQIFKNDYFFRRPKIAKSMEALEDPLKTYILGLEEYDKKIVDDYLNNRGLSPLHSYLDFIDEMSEEFVQVSIDKMIKKDSLSLSDIDLNRIGTILMGLFNLTKKIEVSLLKNFTTFPKLNIVWTHYVLVGIIRSYLDDKFEITNDGAMYDKVKFFVTKK